MYTAEGDSYKCVVDGVDGAGKPAHNEWTGKFDGKDYPLTGDPSADTRSLKLTSPGHYALTNKKDGKTTITGTVELSADNKTRTLTIHMTDAAGKKSDEHRGVRKTVASVPAGRSHRPQPATGPS